MKVFLLSFILLGAVVMSREWEGEGAEEDWAEDTGEDRYRAHYKCDDDCDCMGCEDELDCKDGMGVTRVDLGSIQMKLNLHHDGGKYGVMTTDLIAGVVHCIFSPGDCF